MTQHQALFAALAAPFEPSEVRARTQQGRQLYYVTARTVMNRLDTVLGPENWWDDYVPAEHSVLCRLTVRLPDGTTVTKCDAGGYAGMSDSGDDGKSGYSDSFKRAAVKFGVGRYLYRDGVPAYAQAAARPGPASEASEPAARAPQGAEAPNTGVRGNSPAPDGAEPAAMAAAPGQPARPSAAPAPRTGRALFAWAKEQEQHYDFGLLKYLGGWGRFQEYPARMVDWDAAQVSQAYAEACRKLESLPAPAGRSERYEEALAN